MPVLNTTFCPHVLLRFLWLLCGLLCLLCLLPGCQQKNKAITTTSPPELLQLFEKASSLASSYPDSAFVYFKQLEQRSRELDYELGMGVALTNLGQLAYNKGDNEQALRLYTEALPHCLKVKDKNALPVLYINMGTLYNLQGNFNRANGYYYQALQYLLQYLPDDENVAAAYANLSGVQWSLGQYHKSLYYAQQAEDFIHQHGIKPAYLAGIGNNKGDALIGLKRYPEAFTTLTEGLRIAEEIKFGELKSSLLCSLGELMLAQNRDKESIVYLQQAMQINAKNPYYGYILPRYKLGLAWYRLLEYEKARDILNEAFEKTVQTGQLNESMGARGTLALVYQAMGDYKRAFEEQQILIALKDSLMNKEKVNAINEMEIKFKTAQKDKEIAENKLQISRQENRLNKKNIWIGGTSLGALLLGSIFFSRNRVMQQKRLGQDKHIRILEQEQELLKRDIEINHLEAIVQGEEKERVRIGRDLHDGIVSQLMAVRLHFKGALKNAQDTIPNLPDFQNTLQYLDDATRELRKTAHNLMPETVLQGGLIAALNTFCKKMEGASGTKIYVEAYGTFARMDRKIELSLYRIVQELVQNALKHAAGNYILVQVDATDDLLFITVEDNGIGFATAGADNNEGMGLKSIYTRVKALHGKIDFISKPGTGVTVNMEFNFKPEKEGSTR